MNIQHDRDRRFQGVTRRGFLTGIGAGAGGAVGALTLQPTEAIAGQVETLRVANRPDRFSRLFNLPPFAEPSPHVIQALEDMGAPEGILDARDPLHEGPVRLITVPELSRNNPDITGTITAGITFLGQFLDHDMTFDTTSRLAVPTRPEGSLNSRTPTLDLDSVYGGGPTASPQLYESADRAKFKIESGGRFEDLPRSADATAIIPDPRNDENLMIAGLQVAFLLFHNRVVDWLREKGEDGLRIHAGVDAHDADDSARNDRSAFTRFGDDNHQSVFSAARRLVTWHYQWIIVNEFLPHIVGAPLLSRILSEGPQFYTPRPGEQSIPVEFQAAAYRFGHSLVRPSYRANLAGDSGQPFFGFVFDAEGEGQPDPVDLRGGARAERRFIGWQTFFNFGGEQAANVRPSKTIDTKISTPLFHLPLGAIASGDRPTSLPQRNLLRHLTWSLPSGQAIAQEMGIRALTSSQLSELQQFGAGFEESTPLWYYILKEAELAGGTRLAGVGARIVAEVFIGLLSLDRNSYLSARRWSPTLPSRTRGTFEMVDLLTFAGVDPASRGQ